MTLDHTTQKGELRRKIRAGLRAVGDDERRSASLAVCDLLRGQPVWSEAKNILFYAALAGEINLTPLVEEALAEGKTVALPGFVEGPGVYDAFIIRHLTDDCAPGKFAIAEPKAHCARLDLNRLDLALVPGVGFDLSGHRLGRGKGFYDRLLANIGAAKCGVAFDIQVVERIPAEAHDIRMNYLLTPTRWRTLSP